MEVDLGERYGMRRFRKIAIELPNFFALVQCPCVNTGHASRGQFYNLVLTQVVETNNLQGCSMVQVHVHGAMDIP